MHSNISKPTVLLGILLIISLSFGGYGFQVLSVAKDDLAEARSRIDTLESELTEKQRIDALDSLLFRGEYEEALQAYGASDSFPGLADRMDHLQTVVALQVRLEVLRNRAEHQSLTPITQLELPNSVVPQMPKANITLDRDDSLSIALLQSEAQIRTLQQRFDAYTGPNYLVFTSREGNQVYYVGEIEDGRANGNGVAILSTGSRYIGRWRNNQKHGIGEFYWRDGAWYEGEYEDDFRSGQGTYHFPDGAKYVGGWEDDLRSGNGVYYNKKGRIVAEGTWSNDELVE